MCFYVIFFLRIIHRTQSRWMWRTGWTSQYQLSLSYWKRWWWDWPQSRATLPSCEGWGRPLIGTSYRSVLLLGAGAWRRKEASRGGKKEKRESEKWQLDLRMSPFPSSCCKIGAQTGLSFPLPAPAMHACFYQIASFQGTKHSTI